MQSATRSKLGNADDHGYVEVDPSGRYGRFDSVLGKGAMKTVYKAFDEYYGLEVAWNQVKLSNVMRSPDALQRMYSEVHLLSTLHHDSIIQFHSSWVDVGKNTFNFITEMFTSGTLREYRQRYRHVDIRAVKNWARQILNGLVYLHHHDPPVIHRDLKCDNIFVNGHLGLVKIGDLGLAAVLRGSQAAHSVIGTPEFMAPELYEEEYNELVDIYSFGMCILEMLTAEYPFSECSNPAQIYKKVTSGKLPDAFYRIHDPEARRFIGLCLENVSKRSSAEELLNDPFLIDHRINQPAMSAKIAYTTVNTQNQKIVLGNCDRNKKKRHTDMTITGKINSEDDTIFLKVQIADKDGQMRNIYFPFDIHNDTPIDVANEMVKELEITDHDPAEIAEVISHEILNLVPDWNGGTQIDVDDDDDKQTCHHVCEYEFDVDEGSVGHPFYSMSSPNSSFHGSLCCASHCQGSIGQSDGAKKASAWIVDNLNNDDDEDDTSSMHSGKYSSIIYCSGNECENEPKSSSLVDNTKSTRFQGIDHSFLSSKFKKHCSIIVPPNGSSSSSTKGKKPIDKQELSRNRSFLDLRSQLLHRTLVKELSRRHAKTVGAVENIGFQMPYDNRKNGSSSGK